MANHEIESKPKKKKSKPEGGTSADRAVRDVERATPAGSMVALIVGFVVLALVGVLTVVVPEVTDDGEAEEDAAPSSHDVSSAEPSDEDAPPAGSPAPAR